MAGSWRVAAEDGIEDTGVILYGDEREGYTEYSRSVAHDRGRLW